MRPVRLKPVSKVPAVVEAKGANALVVAASRSDQGCGEVTELGCVEGIALPPNRLLATVGADQQTFV